MWWTSPSLSHGPVILALVLFLLWTRRHTLSPSRPSSGLGGVLILLGLALDFIGAFDEIFLFQTLALLLFGLGSGLMLIGSRAMRQVAGVGGVLLLALPWPDNLVDRVGFPLQVASGTYAGLLCSLFGLPVMRQGVRLSTIDPQGETLYSVLVTQRCSGFTSLLVLGALAYLVAYLTPVRWYWRLALAAVAFPLAILANAIRLAVILAVGTLGSAGAAEWIHDHQTPVLVFLSSLLLVGFRYLLLLYPARKGEESSVNQASTRVLVPAPVWNRYWILGALLTALVLRPVAAAIPRPLGTGSDFLQDYPLQAPGWTVSSGELTPFERAMLQPDTVLVRRLERPDGESVDLSVIVGRDLGVIHNPRHCFERAGWQLIWERLAGISMPQGGWPVTRALVVRDGHPLLISYFFTDGHYRASNLGEFQVYLLGQHLQLRRPHLALVRLAVPVIESVERTEQVTDRLARTLLPPVLREVRNPGGASTMAHSGSGRPR
jgi:EpsI family protein